MRDFLNSVIIGSIIGKFLTGRESRSESSQLKDWLGKDTHNQKLYSDLKKGKNISSAIRSIDNTNLNDKWEKYTNKLTMYSLRKKIFRWKVAAIFLLLFGIAGILSPQFSKIFRDTKEGLMTATVVTDKGQTSKIILPDSTIVWVNSDTKLAYNNGFSINNRNIHLTGEAYFKVKKNLKQPFIVDSKDIQVKVYGTEFDIEAYPDKKVINVTLDEGSIEMLHRNSLFRNFKLKPGEKAYFNSEDNELIISHKDHYKYTSWKDGLLIFKDDPMHEVFEKLERWYGIEIIVKDEKINNLIFNATIRDEDLSDIFDLIGYSCGIKYKITYSHDSKISTKVFITN